MLALAKKYRFLTASSVDVVGGDDNHEGCHVTVTAVLFDDANQPVTNGATTKVRLQIAAASTMRSRMSGRPKSFAWPQLNTDPAALTQSMCSSPAAA